jgi:hypothetical protein
MEPTELEGDGAGGRGGGTTDVRDEEVLGPLRDVGRERYEEFGSWSGRFAGGSGSATLNCEASRTDECAAGSPGVEDAVAGGARLRAKTRTTGGGRSGTCPSTSSRSA